jgi:DNA polymerase I
VLLTVSAHDGVVQEWRATPDGVESVRNDSYTPTIYVDGPHSALAALRDRLSGDPKVCGLGDEQWFTSLQAEERDTVLRIDVEQLRDVDSLAREIKGIHERKTQAPGTYRLFNVDFSREMRYCLETGTAPVPGRELRTLALEIPEPALARADVTALRIDDEPVGDDPATVLETLQARLAATDPDVLVINQSDVLSLLYESATDRGVDGFVLGRESGFEQLAGESTYESYGQVGYSPARFDVPGRVIIDTASSFLWDESGIEGLLDLTERSWRPLQETAWASIGTVLTAIQIREALARDVLVPWNKWDPEAFKTVDELHAADRGGFSFAPEVGVHEGVVELDFASLYPNIMCEENISPDTLNCDCHDGEDVPGLGYTICADRGFIPDVLQPIIDDRAGIKRQLRETDDPAERARLEARSDALKWILVSCFGYQGYRNAKFGRIECHEAINAYAREILLDAKEAFEAGGWRVVHGIVDSIWVTPRADVDQTPVTEIASAVSDDVGIALEYEAEYDWIAFVPTRDGRTGALTKYFGSKAAGDFKFRGIECRQRSTPPFVEEVQRDLVETFDRARDPEAVCRALQDHLTVLASQDVPTEDLVIRKRCSQPVGAYDQYTQTVATLERYRECGMDRKPGQDVRYVVADDTKRSMDRVRLPHESCHSYDERFYRRLLIRAAESVLSPVGWDRTRIRRQLARETPTTLAQFTDG